MQKGRIFRKGHSWFLGWNAKEDRGGTVKWVSRVKKLAPVSDKYRSEASVRHLAQEILAPINARRIHAEGTQTAAQFIEQVYMPFVKMNLRPPTVNAYQRLFNLTKPLLGDVELREFDVPTADRVLADFAKLNLAHTTNRNARNFLSGAFRYALRTGAIRHGNPIRDAVVPKGKPKGVTYAYNLKEIQAMLAVLPEPARTVVLLASLTGLRHAEIRGLKWEDFDGKQLYVRRSVWRSYVGDTKTLNSAAPVPVLPILAAALDAHRKTAASEYIFAGRTGKPLVLANVKRRDIVPALKKEGLTWWGWHSFRRGLATNLYALGINDKTIQAILRHSSVTTTQAHYIKTTSKESRAAIKKIEKALGK